MKNIFVLSAISLAMAGCGIGRDPIVIKDHDIKSGWFSASVTIVVKNTSSRGTRYEYGATTEDESKTFCSGTGYLDAGEEREVTFDCGELTSYSGRVAMYAVAI